MTAQAARQPVKVVMLCGRGASARMMYHGIENHAEIVSVVVEDGVPSSQLFRRRVTKLGLWKSVGQALFVIANKLFSKWSRRRIAFLKESHQLVDAEFPENLVRAVDSINSPEVIKSVSSACPDLVIVNGTRIISSDILEQIHVPIVNTHMGITPRYRGVHGGYWALVNGDRENCGVTIHRVDAGIDTGGVLYQERIQPAPGDSFNTYPVLQMAAAIPLMRKVIDDVSCGNLTEIDGVGPSALRHHPTLWQYLFYWIVRGVK